MTHRIPVTTAAAGIQMPMRLSSAMPRDRAPEPVWVVVPTTKACAGMATVTTMAMISGMPIPE